ncbi:MAG: S41 family peptidase [Pirellulaceae bacterium]
MPRRNLIILFVAALVSLACYQRAARNRFAGTFSRAMNIVTRDYVDEVEPRVLFEGAMDGMMNQLDMYSGYTPPDEFRQFMQQIDGQFPGIGIMVEQNRETKQLEVLVPIPGSPAAQAGMKAGDVIEAIEGQATAELLLERALDLIKGPAGSSVRLTIRRAGLSRPLELEVPRANIAIESVLGDARRDDGTWIFTLLDDPRIGYIRLDSFGERTFDDLRGAFATYRQPAQEIDGLILDLRGNAGGLLDAAVKTCDMLLDEGLIVSTRGRGGVERASFSANPGSELDSKLPLVVLVDRYSASAAEIVAACLQDHDRAVVIGERTWGKGTVQNIEELEGGKSAIRLTIATYWRPSGKDIHKRRTAAEADDWGVRPDPGFETSLTKDEYQRVVLGRRKREITPWSELLSRPTRSPAASPVEPQAGVDTAAPPVPIPDVGEDAAVVEPWFDPALDRAIEYLHEQFALPPAQPRAA